jgi:integrase/recombinase XerD
VFFEFLELRQQPDIHAATGFVVESPLDEVNRPRGGTSSRLRVPPGEREIDRLFTGWRTDMPASRCAAACAARQGPPAATRR